MSLQNLCLRIKPFQTWQSYQLDLSLIPNFSSCPYALFLSCITVAKSKNRAPTDFYLHKICAPTHDLPHYHFWRKNIEICIWGHFLVFSWLEHIMCHFIILACLVLWYKRYEQSDRRQEPISTVQSLYYSWQKLHSFFVHIAQKLARFGNSVVCVY